MRQFLTFGIAGTFEMDDPVPWETMTRNAGGAFAKKHMKLNLQMGMNGIGSSKQVMDWPFPGIAHYLRDLRERRKPKEPCIGLI